MLHPAGRLKLLPHPRSSWAAALVLFIAYVVCAGPMLLYAAHVVSARVNEDLFPLPWVADGVAVSLMLLWGRRTWPGVFLGSIFIWGVMRGDPAIPVGVDAVGETLSVVIAVEILRVCHFRRQLDRLADPLILLAAALAGRMLAGLADIAGTIAGAWLTPHSLPPEFLRMATRPGTLTPAATPELVWAAARWQLNALTGIALTVPVLLASPRKLRHALRSRAVGLACLGLVSLLWVLGAVVLSPTWACWPLLLIAVMLVAWAAMEFGALTAALCTLLFACTAAVAYCQGVGPLATADLAGGLAATWGFIGLLSCVGPVLTVILARRQHHDGRLALLAERYRSLFTSNPTPAWVADAGSGAILMANAEAVRRYGYTEAEFLRMRMSELSAEPGGGAELEAPEGDLVAAPLLKHVTRDGTVMNVELVSTPLELDGRAVALIYAVDMTDHQDLRRRLLATVDRESFRVAQALHDGLGQVLAALSGGSDELLQRTERARTLDASTTAQLRELTEHAERAESYLFRLTSGTPVENPAAGLMDEARGAGPASTRERATAAEADPLALGPNAGGTVAASDSAPAEPQQHTGGLGRPDVAASPDGQGQSRASIPTYLAVSALIVAVTWVSGAFSHALASANTGHFTYADAHLAVPSLAVGVTVAALLHCGRAYWPSVFLAMVLVRLGQIGEPIGTALLMAAAGTAGCCALVAWMQRRGFTPGLNRWQDPVVLCAAAGVTWALLTVAGLMINAILASIDTAHVAPGVAALYTTRATGGIALTPEVLAATARWWFDAVAGTVLVVPTLTLAATFRRVVTESLTELTTWCACLAGWALLLFAVPAHEVLLPLLTVSILLVVWAAARLGVAFASLATLLFAMGATASFATRTGALATEDAATGVTYVWGFVSVLTVISLFLAALLAEHDSRRRAIAAVSKRYRLLFQGDPRPLWVHDAHGGQILDANEPAARAYGYEMGEFTTLKVDQLLAPGASLQVLTSTQGSAVGPLAMKHVRKNGDPLDVEMWSYNTFLDGRRVSICFAHDVTERNTLRRLLFDRAEVERRQLASELRNTLAGPLAELRIVAHKVKLALRRHAPGDRLRELLESLARQAKRAAQSSRELAHRLSPLQANSGNLVAALEELRQGNPAGTPLEISVVAESPLILDPQQSEHLYSLLSEILARCRSSRPGNVQVALRSFGHTLRVAVDADLEPPPSGAAPSLARHPSVLLRVRAMGARLWERSIAGAHTRLVCDYPL